MLTSFVGGGDTKEMAELLLVEDVILVYNCSGKNETNEFHGFTLIWMVNVSIQFLYHYRGK